VPRRLSGLLLLVSGIAYYVDLFLRWGPGNLKGWDVSLNGLSGAAVLSLVLVEVVRSLGVWRTTTSSLLSFFLAGVGAVLGVSVLIHLHWGFYRLSFSAFCYGAWTGLALALLLAMGAMLRLREHLPGKAGYVGPTA